MMNIFNVRTQPGIGKDSKWTIFDTRCNDEKPKSAESDEITFKPTKHSDRLEKPTVIKKGSNAAH